jgi:hypothetical protein
MVDSGIVREQYEWANIWWDHADDLDSGRVLLIGDSISVGYTAVVTRHLEGRARVDRLGTSRSITDPAFTKELFYLLGEFGYRVIHFNNGLHGAHVTDDDYAAGLRAMVRLLLEYGRGARLIWCSSTPVTVVDDPARLDAEKNPVVIRRNASAAQVMAEFGLPTNDLYALAVDRAELKSNDGYHFVAEGQEVLGQAVAEAIAGLWE